MSDPLAPKTPQAALERRLLCLIARELEDYRMRYGVVVSGVKVDMLTVESILAPDRHVVGSVRVEVA